MTKQRIIRIFGAELNSLEGKSFRYAVNKQHKKMFGVLFSKDTALSISLSNEKELPIDGFEYRYKKEGHLPPNKRLLKWKQSFNPCDTITGSITNLSKEARTVNVYLLIEEL